MPNAAAGSMRASMQVRTRYFFAGGSAREPCVKVALYFSDAASTFFCIAVAIASDLLDLVGVGRWAIEGDCGRVSMFFRKNAFVKNMRVTFLLISSIQSRDYLSDIDPQYFRIKYCSLEMACSYFPSPDLSRVCRGCQSCVLIDTARTQVHGNLANLGIGTLEVCPGRINEMFRER
jgi:hypothetical protein